MNIGAGRGAMWGVAMLVAAFVLPLPVPALAQTAQPAQPAPWERNLNRLYERERATITRDPLAKRERELRRYLEDPAVRAGLPPNAPTDAPSSDPAPTSVTAPAFTPDLSRMDLNRDGSISRDEYLRGRNRLTPAGPAGAARQRQLMERMDSRFRDADANHDGRVTPQELDAYGNPRF